MNREDSDQCYFSANYFYPTEHKKRPRELHNFSYAIVIAYLSYKDVPDTDMKATGVLGGTIFNILYV